MQVGDLNQMSHRKPHIPTPSVPTSAASDFSMRSSDAEGGAERSLSKASLRPLPLQIPDGTSYRSLS
jgi:hypothetical protein